jgi:hypothetical protein
MNREETRFVDRHQIEKIKSEVCIVTEQLTKQVDDMKSMIYANDKLNTMEKWDLFCAIQEQQLLLKCKYMREARSKLIAEYNIKCQQNHSAWLKDLMHGNFNLSINGKFPIVAISSIEERLAFNSMMNKSHPRLFENEEHRRIKPIATFMTKYDPILMDRWFDCASIDDMPINSFTSTLKKYIDVNYASLVERDVLENVGLDNVNIIKMIISDMMRINEEIFQANRRVAEQLDRKNKKVKK